MPWTNSHRLMQRSMLRTQVEKLPRRKSSSVDGPTGLIFVRPKLTRPELTESTNLLLTKYVVGPHNKCHEVRRGDEASIFSINVRLGDRTGQRASRSYVEGDFMLYRFGNCLR